MKITMTPEEKFNRDVWYALNKIKKRSFYTKKDGLISYSVNFSFVDTTGKTPSAKDESIILEKLEEWGAIKIKNETSASDGFRSFISNKIFEIKIIKPKFGKLYSNYESLAGTKNQPSMQLPKFHFKQGILFRDLCEDILKIGGENTQEYRLLQTAFELPVKERIDQITVNIDMEWRQLYDTALRLNKKIKDTFKVDNFFQMDFKNRNLHRTVE